MKKLLTVLSLFPFAFSARATALLSRQDVRETLIFNIREVIDELQREYRPDIHFFLKKREVDQLSQKKRMGRHVSQRQPSPASCLTFWAANRCLQRWRLLNSCTRSGRKWSQVKMSKESERSGGTNIIHIHTFNNAGMTRRERQALYDLRYCRGNKRFFLSV